MCNERKIKKKGKRKSVNAAISHINAGGNSDRRSFLNLAKQKTIKKRKKQKRMIALRARSVKMVYICRETIQEDLTCAGRIVGWKFLFCYFVSRISHFIIIIIKRLLIAGFPPKITDTRYRQTNRRRNYVYIVVGNLGAPICSASRHTARCFQLAGRSHSSNS